jgi:hypothetical protein
MSGLRPLSGDGVCYMWWEVVGRVGKASALSDTGCECRKAGCRAWRGLDQGMLHAMASIVDCTYGVRCRDRLWCTSCCSALRYENVWALHG